MTLLRVLVTFLVELTMSDKNNLGKHVLVWAHSLKVQSITVGRHGNKSMRQLVILNPVRKQREKNAGAQLVPPPSVRGSSIRDGAAHIQGRSSSSLKPFWNHPCLS